MGLIVGYAKIGALRTAVAVGRALIRAGHFLGGGSDIGTVFGAAVAEASIRERHGLPAP